MKKPVLSPLVAAIILASGTSARAAGGWDCRINDSTGQWQCQTQDGTTSPKRHNEQRKPAAAPPPARHDWVSADQVPEELRDRSCRQCDGRYVDPLRNESRQQPPEKSDLHALARQTELQIQQNRVLLSGGVSLKQGYRQLSGEEVSVDSNTGITTMSGNIELREPGLLLRGDSATVATQQKTARIENAHYTLHQQHIHGNAAELRRDLDGVLHAEQTKISYCAPDQEHWALESRQLEIDTAQGTAKARGTKLTLGGVPVIYTPYLSFPLDDRRRTGVLWPDLGSDSSGGIDVAVPIYFNLAPNYDLQYKPRYIQDRGLSNQFVSRYLGRHSGLWQIAGSYLHSDKRHKKEFSNLSDHKRWLLQATQTGHYGNNWYSSIDYSRASDVNYLKDLQSDSLGNRRETNLLQRGAIGYVNRQWRVDMEVSQYQSLANDIRDDYKKLPQITGQYLSSGEAFAIKPLLLVQYGHFDINDTRRPTGQRIYAEAGAQYPMVWQAGFLTPTLKYRQLNYQLDRLSTNTTSDQPSAGAALASLDGGLYFERDTQWLNKALVQTLEPRLYYLYSPYRNQQDMPDFDSNELPFSYGQLFRDSRFSGHDRLDDANQVSAGITTRFIDRDNGREYFSASLGQTFYMEDRRVRLVRDDPAFDSSSSEVVAEIAFHPNRRLDLFANLAWDPQRDLMSNANVQVAYRPYERTLVNVGYSYRRPIASLGNTQPITEQTHLSTSLPIGDSNWSLFTSWNYSLEANTSVEDMIGLEYDSCCWKFRLLHLRYFDTAQGQYVNPDDPALEREHSTQVQIVLKGLGGFGSRVSSILEDMIRGYKDSDF